MSEETNNDHGKILLQWDFHEYEKHQRTTLWYLVAFLVVAGLIVWSLITQNYLFTIIVLLASILLAWQSTQQPQTLPLTIYEDGVQIGTQTFYDYREIKNFWMIYEPPKVKKLFFTFKVGVRPDLIIPLERQNPLAVRQALQSYLPEDLTREGEPTSEALGRFLKI